MYGNMAVRQYFFIVFIVKLYKQSLFNLVLCNLTIVFMSLKKVIQGLWHFRTRSKPKNVMGKQTSTSYIETSVSLGSTAFVIKATSSTTTLISETPESPDCNIVIFNSLIFIVSFLRKIIPFLVFLRLGLLLMMSL